MSLFDFKEKMDSAAFGVFNVFSDFVFSCSPSRKLILERNKEFRSIFDGKRCFIVGTGPSIKRMESGQVDFLKNEIVFGVNSFYKAEVLDGVSPKFYALLDNNYLGVTKNAFFDINQKYYNERPTFITDFRARRILKDFSEFKSPLYLYAKNYPTRTIRYDLTGNISITMNVVSACIQAAMFMGFHEIYLLGCDYNAFCNNGSGHCYDDQKELSELPSYNLGFYLKYYYLTTEFHYLIASRAKAESISIINLTPGSLLDAYPRGSISEIMEKASRDNLCS